MSLMLVLCYSKGYSKILRIVPGSPRHFAFDILSFKLPGPATDSVRADIYLAIPYQILEFQYAVDKYVADYGAIVQITDRTSGQVMLDRYQTYNVLESVSAHEQRNRTGQEYADAEQFSIKLAAGRDYEFHLTVRDLSSHREYDTLVHYTTKDFRRSYISISDLMIYRTKRGERIVPSIGSEVSTLSSLESGVFAEVYNAPADSMLGIVSEVLAVKPDHTPDENTIAYRTSGIIHIPPSHDTGRTAPSAIAETPVFLPMAFDDLWVGHYMLKMYILPATMDTSLRMSDELQKHSLTMGQKSITVSNARGIPISESDLTQAIEQLRLIATGSEWDSLSSAKTTIEKRNAILDFWQRKNPNNGEGYNRAMQVFYARVQYANDHFNDGLSQGWKSDRGRVYIALGPPEYIDSHSYDAMQRPYEIWQYPTFHQQYNFVDRYMLGEYRLVGPPPPPGTFIWDK